MLCISRALLRTGPAVKSPPKQRIPISYNPINQQCRTFSASWRQTMRSTELSETDVSALRANKDRMAKDLHHSCQWGYGIRWGK